MGDVFDVVPANWHDLDPLSPGRGGCVFMMCWCGTGEEDDNEKKWEVLRTTQFALCQNGISTSQDVPYTQDESCWLSLQVPGVCHRPTRCNQYLGCYLFANWDKLQRTTAAIA